MSLYTLKQIQCIYTEAKKGEFLAPLLMRLYLFPVFWMAGSQKYMAFSETVAWFGNPDWGLGLPFPYLMAFLVTSVELIGAICLLLGLGVRALTIPLFFVMVVAALAVHWDNGWLAIAGSDGFFATDRTMGAIERLAKAKEILHQYGHYDWLTEHGGFVVLNNGIEFAATYAIMLLSLFFTGAGKFLSVDYWIDKQFSGSDEN